MRNSQSKIIIREDLEFKNCCKISRKVHKYCIFLKIFLKNCSYQNISQVIALRFVFLFISSFSYVLDATFQLLFVYFVFQLTPGIHCCLFLRTSRSLLFLLLLSCQEKSGCSWASLEASLDSYEKLLGGILKLFLLDYPLSSVGGATFFITCCLICI